MSRGSRALTIVSICAALTISAGAPALFGSDEKTAAAELPSSALAIDFAAFTIQASPDRANLGEEVTFYVNASSDIPDATITVSIFYDATLPPFVNNTASAHTVNVTGNPARVVQKFTYEREGNFTDPATGLKYLFVRAFVQDNASGTTNKRMAYFVNNNSAPTVESITPQLSPAPGEPANISLVVRDLDNDSLTVTWDFGDGNSTVDVVTSTSLGAFANQSHTWDIAKTPGVGDYWVNLTVNVAIADGHGHWTNATIPVAIYIPANRGPVPYMTVSSPRTDPENPVTFYASARDLEGDGIYWYFDFGDGTKSNNYTNPSVANTTVWNNQSHMYASSGAGWTWYNATLNVTDGAADHNASTGSLQVIVVPNVAPAVTDTILHIPENLEIDIAVGYLNVSFLIQVCDLDGDVVTATWNMNDGTPPRVNSSAPLTRVYTFEQWRNFTVSGDFQISVTVTDGISGHEVTRYLNATMYSNNHPPMLVQAPTWFYEWGDSLFPDETLDIGMMVTDAERDALVITWDFGDGSPPLIQTFNESEYDLEGNISANVQHAYSGIKDYTIHIYITDNVVGCMNHNLQVNATVHVAIAHPIADAGADEYVWIGAEVAFDGTTATNTTFYNYTWTFTYDGEVVTLNGLKPKFTFQIDGVYVVSLTMKDDFDRSSTDTMTVTVLDAPIDQLSDSALVLSLGMVVMTLVVVSARRRFEGR